MDFRSDQINMEQVEVPLHKHPLVPFTRFASSWCEVCSSFEDDYAPWNGIRSSIEFNIYGGYRCNELGCDTVFHKECAKPLQVVNHPSHPEHFLKLIIEDLKESCSFCGEKFKVGYCCSICDFKLDLKCARRPNPFVLPENSYGHEHSLELVCEIAFDKDWKICKACPAYVNSDVPHYRCQPCEFVIHVDCVDFPEAYHTSHRQHPLKSLRGEVPDYADEECLLCRKEFDQRHHQLHHCDVCNFSICRACMKNPPPVDVESPTTHDHQLHLIARRIKFTCNACGTEGDRSPYFCLQCNFMIHRECIDLPRVININRHDHRISYIRRLGHGVWKCKVCRIIVDGFYGAYTCVKCPSFAVHSLCATRKDVWDMVELEGRPEEEEIPPFEVIDDNTIKHISHDHNLRINKDVHGRILPENRVCEACVLQILSEPFYSCNHCNFILHEKCASHPRKKRHVRNNQPFTLLTDTLYKVDYPCGLCQQHFSGFRYINASKYVTIDVRCAALSDTLEHGSHQHPLYYYSTFKWEPCSRCGIRRGCFFRCEDPECVYILDGKCAQLPKKVMEIRYDDHPLFLSFGDMDVDGEYWCDACETKVNPKEWFYTCNDCGTTLHVSCVVGDFSYIMPGSLTRSNEEVVSNSSICRPLFVGCNSRCKLPTILKLSKAGVDVYVCSFKCRDNFKNENAVKRRLLGEKFGYQKLKVVWA